ncbi:MAG: hypothetical protein P9M15_03155 [Candidatus Electryoneaceae bacterium]|nr:hypothetical protein [Candidatus Electryoneaceae bacterium]
MTAVIFVLSDRLEGGNPVNITKHLWIPDQVWNDDGFVQHYEGIGLF